MATQTTQQMVDAAQDFCCVTVDPYWMIKLNTLRTLAGLQSLSAQEIIDLAACEICQWGKLKGMEMYLLCVASS